MKTISKSVFLLLFVVSGSSYAASWEDLNMESAKALFSDTTIVHSKFKQYSAPDGTQKGEWGGTAHTGKYFINEEGHYCSTWDDRGFAACDAVYRGKGKIIYKVPRGKKGKFRKSDAGNQL